MNERKNECKRKIPIEKGGRLVKEGWHKGEERMNGIERWMWRIEETDEESM